MKMLTFDLCVLIMALLATRGWKTILLAASFPTLEHAPRSPLSVSIAWLHERQTGHGRRRKSLPRRPPAWNPISPHDVNPHAEWSSVFHSPRPFDPYLIPLPLRMGRAIPGSVSPPTLGNLELMKIPNFFHLTPPAIEKHCKALKSLCTPWPQKLPNLPVKVETRNYVFPGPSLHHSGARKVVLSVKLSELTLTDRARRKLIELSDNYYNPKTDTIRLIGKRCPTRKQNKQYVLFLLKVLYLEANKIEPWEEEDSANIAQ